MPNKPSKSKSSLLVENMRTCKKLTGHVVDPNYFLGDTTKTEYLCYESFPSYKKHIPLIKGYLRSYGGVEITPNNPHYWQFFNDQNCVISLVVSFFRDSFKIFKKASIEYVSEEYLPPEKPKQKTKNHRLRVIEQKKEEVKTPKVQHGGRIRKWPRISRKIISVR